MDNFREWLSDNLRYILLGLVILLLLVAVFFGIRAISSKVSSAQEDTVQSGQGNTKDTAEEQITEADTEEITPSATVTPATSDELIKDADAKLTTLIEDYYTALGNKDIDGIKAVVDGLDAAEEAKITGDEYIASYSDVEVYSESGLEEGTYVVYAVYTYRFNGIDADVPGLSQLYVKSDEDGELYIAAQEQDEATETFLNENMNQSDVKALIEQVRTNYNSALADNEELQEFVNNLGVGTSSAASAEDGSEITVRADCNVRKEPDSEAEILGKLGEGETVVKTGVDGDWIKIEYDGQDGYVRSDLFE